MRSVSVRLADLNKVTIPIGFVGENLHTQVRIDCVKLFEDYPNAVPGLTVNPPMGDTYPAVVTRDGDYVIWDIEDSDLTVNGNGEIQLSFFVDEVIAKSYIARIRIEKSLVSTGDVPTPIEDWIDEANEKLAEVEKWNDVTAEATTLEPGESATAEIVEESGHNKFVFGLPKGEQGDPGTPGFSPVVVVTDITGGHRVSVTNATGTPQTFDVMDGEKGDTGNGIASAVLNQDYTLTLNFTDGTHYTTPSIRGAKGEKGDTGNGIASVTLNQDYTLTITYTNGQSITTASIRGEKGETGATPVISIGTVSTLSPGSDATATMDTTDPEHPVLSLGIPEGEPGEVTEAELSAVADSKADVITDTASGAIASFPDGANGMPVKRLVVNVDPVQDLHGQDAPYPPGGGKNILLTAELTLGAPSNTTFSNTTQRTFTVGTYISGLTGTNYYNPRATGITVSDNLIKFTTPAMGYGISIPLVGLEVGSKYTISASTTTGSVGLSFYQQDGTYISSGGAGKNVKSPYTTTVPENTYYTLVYFNAVEDDTEATFTNIQLEKSNSATSYSPYSNICPITGWTGCNVTRTGKNLLKIDSSTRIATQKANVSYENGGIIVEANGTYAYSSYEFKGLKKGKTYCISFNGASTGNYNRVYLNNNDTGDSFGFGKILNSTPTDYSVWFNANSERLYICFYVTSSATTGTMTVKNFQLELGSTASEYTPYVGTTIPISWQSAGTVYGGTLTVNKDGTGTLVVDKIDIDLSNVSWKYNSETDKVAVFDFGIQLATGFTPISNRFSNAIPSGTSGRMIYDGTWFYFAFPKNELSSIDANGVKSWLLQNPTTVIAKTKTPITYDLTALEVIETLKGVNNVWADTGDSAVEYCADTKLYISKRTEATQKLLELIITANHEDSMKATKAYTTGNLLIVNGTLYKATASIANGATLTVGTNVTATTVANELALLA